MIIVFINVSKVSEPGTQLPVSNLDIFPVYRISSFPTFTKDPLPSSITNKFYVLSILHLGVGLPKVLKTPLSITKVHNSSENSLAGVPTKTKFKINKN